MFVFKLSGIQSIIQNATYIIPTNDENIIGEPKMQK